MDYKKAYKKALNRAKKLLTKETVNRVFVEEITDEEIREGIMNFVRDPEIAQVLDDGVQDVWLRWLEKQTPANEMQTKCKQNANDLQTEWSEEDEEMLDKFLYEIDDMLENLPDDYENMDSDDQDRYNELNNMSVWLSNLSPKSHWKPSEEQMEMLKDAIAYYGDSWLSRKQKILESLYEDLKKL